MKYFCLIIFCFIAAVISAQETEQKQGSLMFLLPFGYDYVHLDELSFHNPAFGAGFLLGDQDIPFDEVEKSFLGLALYRPVIFNKEPFPGVSNYLLQAEALFDGRINRHQLLFFFKTSSDEPVGGGLGTYQTGAGWGYEVVRQPNVSLIIGGVLAVNDFGINLPSGDPWPVLPLPLVRFRINTQWVELSFEFIAGPNIEFIIVPKEKFRFTADMRMDYFRSIGDVICEFVLWDRLFCADHKYGDFAGLGIGFKNDTTDFSISSIAGVKSIELQQTSLFAVLDLSILKLEGGWIFDSRYLINGEKMNSPGRGFYVSIQGIIPIGKNN